MSAHLTLWKKICRLMWWIGRCFRPVGTIKPLIKSFAASEIIWVSFWASSPITTWQYLMFISSHAEFSCQMLKVQYCSREANMMWWWCTVEGNGRKILLILSFDRIGRDKMRQGAPLFIIKSWKKKVIGFFDVVLITTINCDGMRIQCQDIVCVCYYYLFLVC